MAPCKLCEQDVYWTDYLSDDQDQAVKNFRAAVRREGLDETVKDDGVTLCRFLKARKWDVTKALVMWKSMVEWRASNVRPADPPFSAVEVSQIRKHYPHFYHKTDFFGRPVYYELLGVLNPAELLKVASVERLIQFHIEGWEHTKAHVLPSCSYAAQRDIFTCTTVLDLKGLKVSAFTKEVRAFVSAIAAIDQNYYPEHLGSMLIINAPMVFSGMWAVVKPWLEARTQKKIQVIASTKQSCEALQALIPRANLLRQYGGDSVLEAPYNESHGPWADSELLKKALRSEYASSQGSLIGVEPESE